MKISNKDRIYRKKRNLFTKVSFLIDKLLDPIKLSSYEIVKKEKGKKTISSLIRKVRPFSVDKNLIRLGQNTDVRMEVT